MIVELPSGNKVTLRESVTNGDRKRYVETLEASPREEVAVQRPVAGADGQQATDPITGEPVFETRIVKEATWSAALSISDVMLGLLITEWTFDVPVPAMNDDGVAALDNLELGDYDTISEAARPLVQRLFITAKPDPDTSSPTEPSSV